MSLVLWSNNFIEAQGYTVEYKSCTEIIRVPYLWKITRDYRYQNEQKTSRCGIFIKDRIDKENVEVYYFIIE